MSKGTGRASWINYAVLALIVITLIVTAYSTTTTITPEISIPEDLVKTIDIAELATKNDLSHLATESDLADVLKMSDLDAIKNQLDEIKEAIGEIRPSPTPTPPLTVSSVFLWEEGVSQLVAGPGVSLTNLLFNTLNRVNLQATCVLSDDRIREIKENDKLVELSYRFYEDIPPLGNVKYAFFILEDNLNEGLEAHILVYTVMPEEWSCWAIQQEGSDELDAKWVKEISDMLEEVKPVTFSMSVIPESIEDCVPSQKCVFLISVDEVGNGKTVEISATASDSTVTVNPNTIAQGQVAEVTVIPQVTSVGKTLTVSIQGELDGQKQTETVTLNVQEGQGAPISDLSTLADEIRDKFIPWLATSHPELGITGDTEWEGTIVKPHIVVVMYYLYFSEEWEMGLTWHVTIEPHNWARIYLRRRFTEASPSHAFELSSWSMEDYEIRAVDLEDAFAESVWR